MFIDIKDENLLLDDEFSLKIADFGIAENCKHGTLIDRFSGTALFMSPEMVKKQSHDGFLADLWACTVVLFGLYVGVVPFMSASLDDKDFTLF